MIFVSICFLLITAGMVVGFYTPASFDPNPTEQLFTIQRGASVRTIVADLKTARLIRFEYPAYLYFRLLNKPINAGTYKLSSALSISKLYAYLQAGKQELIKVTVPEGLTLSKTAAILEERQVISFDDFLAAAQNTALLESYGIIGSSAEGFLFPDTYFFSYNETADRVIMTMLDNFFSKTAGIPHFPDTPEQRYETVILASIIEREYRVPEEAVKIAGVFSNRLRVGMGLQSCATVEYILTEIQHKPHPERLLNRDLEIEHPYNTYKWRGLPPGPIASPGMTALHAACNPEKNSYLYFRLENAEAGTHIFTKTLTEHVKAGSLILKRTAGR